MAEIAACLEDSDSRIRDLAGLFFSELGKRGSNPVYNLLPDAIGRLSRDDAIDPAQFRSIAKFLLAFVGKDKQCEALVEKLCHRIYAATGVSGEGDTVTLESVRELQQCRDFAFCIAQLKLGEGVVKKLCDALFKLYRPVLADEVVYTHLQQIAAKARVVCANKEDLKQTVEASVERASSDPSPLSRALLLFSCSRARGVAHAPSPSHVSPAGVDRETRGYARGAAR